MKIEVLKNGYLCDDEIISAEFKERAQDIRNAREYMNKQAQLINNYVELVKMLK